MSEASPELSNQRAPRAVAARRLASRSFRGKQRLFLAEGPQAVREAADLDGVLVELFATGEAAERYGDIVAAARKQGAKITPATPELVASLSETVTPQGLVGVCRFLDVPLDAFLAEFGTTASSHAASSNAASSGAASSNTVSTASTGSAISPGGSSTARSADSANTARSAGSANTTRGVAGSRSTDSPAPPKLVAILAHVRDPGNAGTVLRCADAAGADLVVVTSESVDVYNPKAVRASAGSLFHVPVAVGVTAEEAVAALREAGLRILAADGTGAADLDDELDAGHLAAPTAWLFGNEAWGLPEPLLALADEAVRVPIHGRAESLNLATAAAVCLYSSARAQR